MVGRFPSLQELFPLFGTTEIDVEKFMLIKDREKEEEKLQMPTVTQDDETVKTNIDDDFIMIDVEDNKESIHSGVLDC